MMKRLQIALLGLVLPCYAFANTCSSEGFEQATKANAQMLTDMQLLSGQYVAVCSWNYTMSNAEICRLFTDKLSQLDDLNDQPLQSVLASAEKAADRWYSVHEQCASDGNRKNSSAAFSAYENSFSHYEQFAKEVETTYNLTCRTQIVDSIDKYCQ
ncbi:hypothetical protein ACVFI8_16915 [Agarivorans sp. MS3-6]